MVAAVDPPAAVQAVKSPPKLKNDKGKLFVSKVTLDPTIVFSGEKRPSPEQIADMHHLAHQECFIANSVLTEVEVAGLPSH